MLPISFDCPLKNNDNKNTRFKLWSSSEFESFLFQKEKENSNHEDEGIEHLKTMSIGQLVLAFKKEKKKPNTIIWRLHCVTAKPIVKHLFIYINSIFSRFTLVSSNVMNMN